MEAYRGGWTGWGRHQPGPVARCAGRGGQRGGDGGDPPGAADGQGFVFLTLEDEYGR